MPAFSSRMRWPSIGSCRRFAAPAAETTTEVAEPELIRKVREGEEGEAVEAAAPPAEEKEKKSPKAPEKP